MKSSALKLVIVTYLLIISACNNQKKEQTAGYININGLTMGTSYNVQYKDSLNQNFQTEFDSILKLINHSMSTYDPNSIISQFNAGNDSSNVIDIHFEKVFKISQKIYDLSNGFFNPSVYPLVKYWGFAGGAKPVNPDSSTIDSLLTLCDFKALQVFEKDGETFVGREKVNVQLDFSAVAKGYAVDVLSNFIESKNIHDYLVEIGGEVRCSGLNPDNNKWSVGIDYPIIEGEKRKLGAIIKSNKDAIATSGNYRNFYSREGKRYAHILDPNIGYSFSSNILSASVIADNCAEADALATALMAGGKTLFDSLQAHTKYEILLISSETDSSGEEVLKPIMSKSLKDKVEWLLED